MGNQNTDLDYNDVCKALQKIKENLENTRYKYDEIILQKCIDEEKYLKSDFEYVYYISTLINSFYSTRMGNDRLYEVAKFISEKQNIDTLEKVIGIINEAQDTGFKYTKKEKKDGKIITKEIHFRALSFLTKYYAIHNRMICHEGEYSDLVILDSNVETNIKNIIDVVKKDNPPKYSKEFKNKMKTFFKKDIKDYRKLYEILTAILNEINRTKDSQKELNYTDLDKYFWKNSELNSSKKSDN